MDRLERAAYLAHSMSAGYRNKVAASVDMIAANPGYAVSTSWGKDSVVLLSLAASVRPEITVIHGRYSHPAEQLSDIDRVRDEVLSREDMARVRYIEVTCPGEWEMFERAGCAFLDAETSCQKNALKWWREGFLQSMKDAMTSAGSTGVFIGMRQDESRARRMNIALRGAAYVKADGVAVALPLARWSGNDVWARLISSDLPWLRMYDVADQRDRARSSFAWGAAGSSAIVRHGAWTTWRDAYPDEYQMWIDRFPELKRWTHE